jgi:hypothetical protein
MRAGDRISVMGEPSDSVFPWRASCMLLVLDLGDSGMGLTLM